MNKHSARLFLALSVVVTGFVSSSSDAQRADTARTIGDTSATSSQMEVTRKTALVTTKGPAATFTGNVSVTPLFKANEHMRASSTSVRFEAGARSAWHSHPAGQTLIVTEGVGWVQERGGEKKRIEVGDVVWTPPGVVHWHGASAESSMTHIAMSEQVDGKAVTWMEHVSDAHYRE